MKKFLLPILLFLIANGLFAQQKGISYQAVLINAKNISAPGQDVYNAPLNNKNICILFTVLDVGANTEYQEYQTTTTDAFGMVNLVIGTGTRSGGYVSLLSAVNWGLGNKTLVVAINALGNCSDYTEISREKLNYVPYAFYAENSNVADGSITTAKLADGAVTDIKVAPGINKTKVGLGNVDNTSDANKPISTATQTALNLKEDVANKSLNVLTDGSSDSKYPSVKATKDYVDSQLANATISDATIIQKGKIQLAGDLAGTADAPLVADGAITDAKVAMGINKSKVGLGNVDNTSDANKPTSAATQTALNLKEDLTNKSNNFTTDGGSTTKYPSVKATKDYVDSQLATATISDATTTQKGKIQLAGDLAGTGTSSSAPIITDGAITSSKILDGAVTDAKIVAVGAAKISGTVSVSQGGTGANTLSGYIVGNGTNPFTTVSSIPVGDISGAVKSVNGSFPAANGNVTISFGTVTTGSLADRPLVAGDNGDIYVVSNNVVNTADNGRTYISDGTDWQEVTANQAATDARYVQLAGSTMQGNLVFPTGTKATIVDAPSASIDVTNKAYVDKKLDKVLTTAETIVTTSTNTLSITGLQDVDLNSTTDQILTVNPTTGVIGKTTSLKVFKEYVTDHIATDGQTQFTTSLTIDDISKVNVYRNGIRINAVKINANTIQIESGAVCYANDEIKIIQFN